MIGLSTQKMLRQRLDITANNLANMTTTGFKVEHVVQRELSERPAHAAENPENIVFAESWRLQRDMSTGPIERTGNPLDFAIEGEGFFVLEAPSGERVFTRDGGFSIDADGFLVSRNGYTVMGAGGRQGVAILGEGEAPIQLDPDGGPVQVAGDGAIVQRGQVVGQIATVRFETPEALEKRGSNVWTATDEEPEIIEEPRIVQGALEGSNVSPVKELTYMIETARAYEGVARMIKNADDMRSSAINKLAQVRG